MSAQQRDEARVLGSDAAVAVGRFTPDGPLGYRARCVPDAPLRPSRDEAVADQAAYLAALSGAVG